MFLYHGEAVEREDPYADPNWLGMIPNLTSESLRKALSGFPESTACLGEPGLAWVGLSVYPSPLA